jgi:hypothetical protein
LLAEFGANCGVRRPGSRARRIRGCVGLGPGVRRDDGKRWGGANPGLRRPGSPPSRGRRAEESWADRGRAWGCVGLCPRLRGDDERKNRGRIVAVLGGCVGLGPGFRRDDGKRMRRGESEGMSAWVPAFAGTTSGRIVGGSWPGLEVASAWVPASAGMTARECGAVNPRVCRPGSPPSRGRRAEESCPDQGGSGPGPPALPRPAIGLHYGALRGPLAPVPSRNLLPSQELTDVS